MSIICCAFKATNTTCCPGWFDSCVNATKNQSCRDIIKTTKNLDFLKADEDFLKADEGFKSWIDRARQGRTKKSGDVNYLSHSTTPTPIRYMPTISPPRTSPPKVNMSQPKPYRQHENAWMQGAPPA